MPESGELRLLHSLAQGDGGLSLPAGWRSLAATADGAELWIGTTVEPGVIRLSTGASLDLIDTIELPEPAEHLALMRDNSGAVVSGNGRTLWLSRSPDISIQPLDSVAAQGLCAGTSLAVRLTSTGYDVLTPAQDEAVRTVALSEVGDARACAVTSDDRWLFIATFSTSSVWVVDLTDDHIVHAEPARTGLGGADALALSESGDHLLVTGACDHDAGLFQVDDKSPHLTWVTSAFGRPANDDCSGEPAEDTDDGGIRPISRPGAVALNTIEALIVGSDQFFNVRRFTRGPTTLSPAGAVVRQPAWNGANKTHFELQAAAYALPIDYEVLRGGFAAASVGDSFAVSSFRADAVAWVTANNEAQYLQAGAGGLTGLSAAYNLALSPDGLNVYVASRESSGVRVGAFAISENGLTPVSSQPVPLPEFWNGAVTDVVVRPDGKAVMVTEGDFGRVHVFMRHADRGGALTHAGAVQIPMCGDQSPFPVGIKVTADGRDVLVSDYHDDIGCLHVLRWTDAGLEVTATHSLPFLAGIENTASTRDGRHVYAAAFFGPGVGHFVRDPETGGLTAQVPLLDDRMRGIENIVLTNDESGAIVANPFRHRLFSLHRDQVSGVLSIADVLERSDTLPIDGISGVAVSPDGARVYAACRDSDSVMSFARDTQGRLTPLDRLHAPKFLRWSNGMFISPDGRHIFAASSGSNRISMLSTGWRP